MTINPLTQIDFYKADHRRQYPKGTELVYSNFTPRSAKHSGINDKLFNGGVTFFGLQYFIKHFLQKAWHDEFFSKPKEVVINRYKRRMDNALGKDSIPVDHIEKLYALKYLPICIKALPEGTCVPIGIPCLIMYNTKPEFFWLTNYLESVLSCYLWKPTTSATTAHHYRLLLDKFAEKTSDDMTFVDFQGHDFSFRGMSGPEDAALSGAGHLLSFKGTDTVAAIDLLEDYYKGNSDIELLGCSVPATEHSVMCMGTKENEIDTFRRLIIHLYPKGIVSIVSDTWDFWKVLTEYTVTLKDEINRRDGKVVFRPDSGNPVDIICGKKLPHKDKTQGAAYTNDELAKMPEYKGAVECLWDVFGGTVNDKGYKVLSPKVGVIYGDSITLEIADAILGGLEKKGFASTNVVFGIGSFTYQHVTRDTFGFAVKSTYGIVEGKEREIFKDPKTDDGTKRSAKGILHVIKEDGKLKLKERGYTIDVREDQMRDVYRDGVLLVDDSVSQIRNRVRTS